MGEAFSANYQVTIGADFSVKFLETSSISAKLQIWDLSGQPRFDKVRKHFYTKLDGVIFVFDISRSESLENFPNWINEASSHNPDPVPLIVFGNKIDLKNEETPTFPTKLTYDWSGEKEAEVIMTSAKTGENVSQAFDRLFETIFS